MLLNTGDWHITDQTPEKRTDPDFFATVLEKVDFLLNTAHKANAIIVQPGDFFDTALTPYDVFGEVLSLIRSYPSVKILTVPGQHDLRYRREKKIPLLALNQAFPDRIIILRETPHIIGDIAFYGAGFNRPVPPIVNGDHTINVLVTHRMIINNKKLYPSQGNYEVAHRFLQDNPFDLIVSGDNHEGFIVRDKDKVLFNMGSLVRTRTDQMEHKPRAVLMDPLSEARWTIIDVPIEPAEDVFDARKIEKTQVKNELLEEYYEKVKAMRDRTTNKEDRLFDYTIILTAYMKNPVNDVSIDVQKELTEALEENE
jgi:DNA repair exonuclease SbcCD nuclease subunit